MSSRLAACCCIALACVALACLGASDSPEDQARLKRLLAMPPSERERLQKSHQEFESLDPKTQERIRAINEKIHQDPGNRDRLLAELHRYQLWLNKLSPERQEQIRNAENVNEWRDLVLQFSKDDPKFSREKGFNRELMLNRVVLEHYGRFSPVEMAARLNAWTRLSKTDQAKQTTKFKSERLGSRRAFMTEIDEVLDQLRPIVETTIPPQASRKFQDKLQEVRKQDRPNATGNGKLIELRMIDSLLLTRWELSRPKPEKLDQFYRSLPEWEKTAFEDLSPSAARRGLEVLYRCVYPEPKEYEPPKAASPDNKKKSDKSAPDTINKL